MKKLMMAAALLVSAAGGAMAQNVTINIGDSGYYGRIDLGNLSRPPVIYQQPMIIQRVDNYRRLEPLYLRVPPGHAKKWSKHCARYDACGRQVYFVQDSWYNNTYAPRYRQTSSVRERDHGRDVRVIERGGDGYRDHDRYDKHDKRDKHDKHDKPGKGNKHDRDDHGKGHGNGKH